MVIVPQLNNNTMITEIDKQALLKELNNIFPGKKAKGSANADGSVNTLALVVEEVDKDQLWYLQQVVGDIGCDIKIKRSGTGLSIKFFNKAMHEQVIKQIDEMLGHISLAEQLLLLKDLESDIEVRIEGVEEQIQEAN